MFEKKQNVVGENDISILSVKDIQNIEKISEIGFGGGGKVYKVAVKKIYALKEMNISNAGNNNFKNFIKEYEFLNMFNHLNIIKTYGIFLSNKTYPPSILLEFCPFNMDNAIKNKILSNVQIICSIYQIVEGMKYLHFHKIIHRDLKPSNILIADDGTIKICDFGISKLMTTEEQSLTYGIGTQKFMAPEIIDENEYDEKVDVYSFGVLIFFMLSEGNLPKIKISEILKGKKADIPPEFTAFSKQLIYSCWNFDPKERPSFNEICEQIESNHYNLFELSASENHEIQVFITQFKERISQFSS